MELIVSLIAYTNGCSGAPVLSSRFRCWNTYLTVKSLCIIRGWGTLSGIIKPCHINIRRLDRTLTYKYSFLTFLFVIQTQFTAFHLS